MHSVSQAQMERQLQLGIMNMIPTSMLQLWGDKVYLINKMNVRDLTDVYDTMINGNSEEETKSESDSTESDAEDTAEATATLEK